MPRASAPSTRRSACRARADFALRMKLAQAMSQQRGSVPRAVQVCARRRSDQLTLDVVEALHALLQRATRMRQPPRDQIQTLAPVRQRLPPMRVQRVRQARGASLPIEDVGRDQLGAGRRRRARTSATKSQIVKSVS